VPYIVFKNFRHGWEAVPFQNSNAGEKPHFFQSKRLLIPRTCEKHRHGAAPTTAMTHIAVQEKKEGKVVDWMEQVSEEQYRAAK
jgi:hypothetical protein